MLGSHLDRAISVAFLDPSLRGRVVSSDYIGAVLHFEVAADASPGPHFFRLITPRGASNLRLFRVGGLPHRLEQEPNSSFQLAETVSPPLTLNGRLDSPDDFDVFRFAVDKGSTWIFDVRGTRNGNGVDTTLLLFDERQRKLAHSEDYFLNDPLISYTFPDGGWYYALVQSKGNSPNFAYQLDIRTSPHLETISPLSFAPGKEAEATLFGEAILDASSRLWFSSPGFSGELLEVSNRSARARIRVPKGAAAGPHRLALVTPEGRSDTIVFQVDATPRHPAGPRIVPPVSINGIATFPEPARFWFAAQAGQVLVFEVRAQQLGSPVDSILRILNGSGSIVAMNDDATLLTDPFNHDSRIVHTFSETGMHELEMRNLVEVIGENYPYQLVVRPPEPSVDLILNDSHTYIYPNDTRRVKIKVDRRDGFKQRLPITVVNLPDGIEAEPAEIGEGQTEAELVLHAGNLQPGGHFALKVSGGPDTYAWQGAKVGTTTAFVSALVVAVAERPRFAVEAGLKSFSVVRGGAVKVPVRIERAGGFTVPLRVWLDNLPVGLRCEPVVGATESDLVALTLYAAEEARAGLLSQVILLGASEDGEIHEAPRVAFTVN